MEDRYETTYKNGVTLALGGFQFLEETLKTYLEIYFEAVRKAVKQDLHFGFERKDHQESALGRLVKVFSKTCPDKELISDLRKIVPQRDHIAHQALLRFFHPQPVSAEEYVKLLSEIQETLGKLNELGHRITVHLRHVAEVRDRLRISYLDRSPAEPSA